MLRGGKMKEVLVLGSDQYGRPFERRNTRINYLSAERWLKDNRSIKQYDLVVFCGGTDVNPALYGEQPHPYTSAPDKTRDEMEMEIYDMCVEEGIPMAGICRGSQFLTVMNGGKLIQHIEGHAIAGTHPILYWHNQKRRWISADITSTHHQMMWAEGCVHTRLAFGGMVQVGEITVSCTEAVWYPRTKCLCVQGHPEYMPKTSSGWKMYQYFLKEYLNYD
jgi:gamma-glutamyl-gamma-aminobutyrate hydrolase PuuD